MFAAVRAFLRADLIDDLRPRRRPVTRLRVHDLAMYLPQGDRRMVVTPQLALRVAILGGIALVLFAVIFFRLWYLQVLSGDKYLAEANDNRVREVKVEAPRGKIVDRNGTVLVDNRLALVVQVQPEQLPEDRVRRARMTRRLGRAS